MGRSFYVFMVAIFLIAVLIMTQASVMAGICFAIPFSIMVGAIELVLQGRESEGYE